MRAISSSLAVAIVSAAAIMWEGSSASAAGPFGFGGQSVGGQGGLGSAGRFGAGQAGRGFGARSGAFGANRFGRGSLSVGSGGFDFGYGGRFLYNSGFGNGLGRNGLGRNGLGNLGTGGFGVGGGFGGGYGFGGVFDDASYGRAFGSERTIIVRPYGEAGGMVGIRDAAVLPPVVYVIGGQERARRSSRSSSLQPGNQQRGATNRSNVRVVQVTFGR